MFIVNDLNQIAESRAFISDFEWVRQSMASKRFDQPFLPDRGAMTRLNYFAECVLASAPSWGSGTGMRLCRFGAEIMELLSTVPQISADKQRYLRFRSALLYELAELPARSSTILEHEDVYAVLEGLFSRKGVFDRLQTNGALDALWRTPISTGVGTQEALAQDAFSLAQFEQGRASQPQGLVSEILTELAKHLSIGLKASDLNAFSHVVENRLRLATRSNVDPDLFVQAAQIQFPTELWSNQVEALQGGLLDNSYDSWGFAAPTGTGKTFLARLLILKTIQDRPASKILYLVPTRALVYEVATSLNNALQRSSYSVLAISPQLIDLDEVESDRMNQCSVAVLTPEKADLLLRLGADFMDDVSLVVVDEAHHIEDGSRGVLLELYLWRIKRLLGNTARIVLLSAVAPNIGDMAKWLGKKPGGVTSRQRATRMRVGVYRLRGSGRTAQGWIEYSDRTNVRIISSEVDKTHRRGLAQLAEQLCQAGPVLVVAKGKGECEALALTMKKWLEDHGRLKDLSNEESQSAEIQRLDSRLEREMYAAVEMRELLPHRIAYHHAGLPPRVRMSVEDAIRRDLIDYVFATTTLAQGVNFPFSSVIVQSLALREPPEKGRPSRYHIVTPRSFWNIAGRAGRPGRDREGQAILFEPSLGLDKINAIIGNYLNPDLNSIEPVRSALGETIRQIATSLNNQEFSESMLTSTVLDKSVPKRIHGAINLLRVGLVHAKSSKIMNSPEDIIEGSFAYQNLDDDLRKVAKGLLSSQNEVVDRFLSDTESFPIELVSELGVSLETLQLLRDYVKELEDWQITHMGRVMYGGYVNLNEAPYIVGPVAKRMTELEGAPLGGLYSEIIVLWISGVPFTTVRSRARYGGPWARLEDLISVVYSRIQYLLPWGLYAMHRIVEVEAKKRSIPYNDEIRSLAYLADSGVPNFDAFRLAALDIERVDATRLSAAYRRRGGQNLGVDVVGWLINERKEILESAVRGSDNRRVDYDLFPLIDELRSAEERERSPNN